MDERRVADYFVVVGLPDNPLPLEEISNEAAIKSSYKQDPITDICVINKSLGEKVPKNFTCIAKTVSNFAADLNHGSIRCHEMYLCFRRSREKPPLIDVGVLYEGKERLMPGCEVVHTTPWGSPANVNNTSNGRIYITFRRAKEEAPSDTLTVVDICVILSNKNENPPHAYHCIEKNLNKGMIGSDVFICYKKAVTKADILAYKPAILDRYPQEDYESFPLPESVPMFCIPMGASIECWSAKAQHPLPIFSTFVLTVSAGEKVYGAAVQFYEEFEEDRLTDLQMRHLGLKNKHIREQYRILKTVHSNKCICLLSHWPFFDAFRLFLTYLYRNSITGPHSVPLERHISHFMYDVPYPSPQRPNILVQLSHEAIFLSMPDDSPLPKSGASFITMLKNLGPENCMSLLLYILHEHKVLIHSLRPAVLTGVAEAVINMIFPLHWQCPYIPLCPLGLSGVLSAPVPFVVGIDSRYFDLYDPPSDVVCVDLDTITISLPDEKKNMNYRNLPKKASRILQDTLHKLFDELCQNRVGTHVVDEITLELAPMEHDFRMKRKETLMELRIQEAFLRFMACILKGYRSFLKPITRAPTLATTDVTSLFDMQGFLKSRDKANSKFYQSLTKTQTFIRFIEERSFVSDNDASLAFFDECTEKVEETKDEPKLIELDQSQNSERTVFIMPPEPVGLPEGAKYSYNGFPLLKPELFLRKHDSELSVPTKGPMCPNSPISRRSKQEIRTSQKKAQQYASNAMLWAKCLLSHCYSLWFIHLPAFIEMSETVETAMKMAYDVLQKMQLAKLEPPDEVCYRVMLQLCGQHNMPIMAVKVLYQMKRAKIQPNAITYGYYNKAVFEGTWPTTKSKASVLWKKIRNVIIGIAQFRRGIRRRSASINSYSGSEYDGTSLDSFLEEHPQDEKQNIMYRREVITDPVKNSTESEMIKSQSNKEESSSQGGISDKGYSSMTHEELKTITETNSQEEIIQPIEKAKREIKGSLRFNIPKRQRSNEGKNENGVEDDHIKFIETDHPEAFRQRVGSIVRKSLGSVSSSGSKETLVGSTMSSSSAGLLMVSSQNLENEDSLHSLDTSLHNSLNLGHGSNSRKRHKSAGDYHTKPRANSLFTGWRPRHVSGDDRIQLRFSDLSNKEDNLFIEESDKLDNSLTEETKTEDDTKDSGVVLDVDNTLTNNQLTRPTSVPIDTPTNSSRPTSLESPLLGHSIGTPVTENDPLGFFSNPQTNEDSSTKTNSNVSGKYSPSESGQNNTVLSSTPFSDSSNSSTKESMFTIGQEKIECNKVESREDRTFSLGSIHSLDGTSDTQPMSPLERVGKRLKDVGRTNSSPGFLAEDDTSRKSGLWPVKGYLSSLQSPSKKSAESLEGTPEVDGNSESRFKRLGSFRKHKERLSGAFKFGAGALANKFSELKQTITPTKLGSNSSIDVPEDSRGVDVPKRHSAKDMVDGGVKSVPNRQASLGSLMPSSSFIEQYIPLKEFGLHKAVQFASLQKKMSDIAMEIEISSTCRCSKCKLLLYDEEIMSGWSADDSNLNTTCIFCSTKLVPNLQIYMKDWRGSKNPKHVDIDDDKESDVRSSHSGQDPWILQDQKDSDHRSSLSSLDNQNGFFFGEEHLEEDDSMSTSQTSPSQSPSKKSSPTHLQAKKDSHLAEAAARSPGSPTSSNSSYNLEELAAKGLRRRCASECFTSATDNMLYGSSYDSNDDYQRLLRSPLRISIGEDDILPSGPDPAPEMKKDFMDRCTSSLEPVTVPYLSPLVLRKELENILLSEGDLSLTHDNFLDEHPIIFWNLVWYFKRIEVPSHLPGFLLTAKSLNNNPQNEGETYYSDHVLLRPQWDNTRIHEEAGLPMYKAWNEGHSSHTVDALITEAKPFNRAILHQIITNIQCNDLLSPIKMVMNCRRRLRMKCRHRSMYRDILFLALVACGRENIDCDAFDREFRNAFLKLSQMEMKRTQRDDRPRKTKVIWCRKVFGELEV